MLLGGNPPFQPQVGVSNGSVDNPGGAGGAAALPFGMTAIDPVFKHPIAYMFSGGVQRADAARASSSTRPTSDREGRNLQRERNINQLPAGTVQANPGINTDCAASLQGLRRHPAVGERRTLDVQQSAAERGSPLQERVQVRRGLHARATPMDNASDKRDILFNSFDDSGFWGNSNFDRRHVFNFYYIYDLPFFKEQTDVVSAHARRLADLRRHVHAHGHAALGHAGRRHRRHRRHHRAALEPGRRSERQRQRPVLGGRNADQNFWFNPAAFARPANGTFGNAPRNDIYSPGQYQWDIALFKNVERARDAQPSSSARRSSTS